MSAGDWLAWAFFILSGLAVGAIAVGWIPIGTARSRAEAHQSRQVVGASAIFMGAMLAVAFPEPIAWVAAAALAGGGAAVFWTARKRSFSDKVRPVRDIDLNTVGRRFVFDSRPPARGPLEIHPRRGWTIFIALAGIGCLVLIVGATLDTLDNEHLDWFGRILFIGGLGGFLLLLIVLPALWWTQRAVRRIPFLLIDSEGLTFGRTPSRDPSITWDDIAGIDVRVTKSNGITDRILIITPRDSTLLARQRLSWRIGGAISNFLYDSPFVISTLPLAISFDELVSRIEAHRPGLLQPEGRVDQPA